MKFFKANFLGPSKANVLQNVVKYIQYRHYFMFCKEYVLEFLMESCFFRTKVSEVANISSKFATFGEMLPILIIIYCQRYNNLIYFQTPFLLKCIHLHWAENDPKIFSKMWSSMVFSYLKTARDIIESKSFHQFNK